MELKNEFASIKFENKDGIETKYETLFQTVKDELLKIYIPYGNKVAHGIFTDRFKNKVVCEIMEHHKDSIEQEDESVVAINIMNILNSLIS